MEQHKDIGSYIDIAYYRLKTAEEDLDAAKKLFQDNSIRIANNRAYYAIYHAVSAVHALDKKAYKRHKDAISNFDKDYIRTEIFPKEFGRRIVRAEEIRHNSDYSDFYIAKREDAEGLIGTAEELISLIKRYVCEEAQKTESK